MITNTKQINRNLVDRTKTCKVGVFHHRAIINSNDLAIVSKLRVEISQPYTRESSKTQHGQDHDDIQSQGSGN
jgi:hypothetical protein